MVMLSEEIKQASRKTKRPKSQQERKIWMHTSSFFNDKEEEQYQSAPPTLNSQVPEYYNDLMEYARSIPQKVKSDQVLSPSPVLAILHKVIEKGVIDELYNYAIQRINEEGFPSQSIGVTAGSLKIGQGLEYNMEELLKLGIAGFFENVGMYMIPDSILEKRGKLTPDEMNIIKQHPYQSAKIIERMGEGFKWLQEIVLQVHERWDGTGYPRRLKGEEILEPAMIIGIMDVYIAMIKKKPYRDRFLQTEAIKSIIDIEKEKFSPRVTREFLKQITLFPINTYVKLNNAVIGKVISTNKDNPMRPIIQVLYDGVGKRINGGKFINLKDNPMLHIVGTLDEKDVVNKLYGR